MLGHEELRTLITAIGCGFHEDFNLEKRRYGKIIIMTDADVDGSHIRTLLLTFFFRHMQELIKAGRVYVAQPPLYQVLRKKKSEYMLNERTMRKALTDLGLEGTQLIIRSDEGKERRRLAGEELRRATELLSKLEELARVVQRRGIDFADFLSKRRDGRLPQFQVIINGEEKFFQTAEERDESIAPAFEEPGSEANGRPEDNGKRVQKNQELHEARDLDKLFNQLEQLGLSIEDYFLTQEESVSGEKLATKYALVSEDKVHDVRGGCANPPGHPGLGKDRHRGQAIQGPWRNEQRAALGNDARSEPAGADAGHA